MNHGNLQNYRILQRNKDGFAEFQYRGTLPNKPDDNNIVAVRAMREDDNMEVFPWTRATVCEEDGAWRWSFPLVLPEGGLYRIETAWGPENSTFEWASRVDLVQHIGVGDLYVMAGQSNMTGYGRDSAYDPPTLGVHALYRDGNWGIAAHPLSDSIDSVYGYAETCTASSPALAFARRLHERLGIPVGLIPAAIGGSPLSAWDPSSPEAETYCWQPMRRMIADAGAFRGMIWFQGCSDANPEYAGDYFERFSRSVKLWREEYGEFPILTVQLNRWTAGNDSKWGMIKDAQRRAALEIPGVYLIPAHDQPTTDGIHNSAGGNVVIGERLAACALAEIYHKPGQCAAHILSAEPVGDNRIRIRLTPGHNAVPMDGLADGMNIEDENGLIACTKAAAEKDAVLVDAERPFTLPAYFHYAWRCRSGPFFLRDCFGMPVTSCYHLEIKNP